MKKYTPNFAETLEKLVFGFSCRETVSDVRLCEEDGCPEPGLPCTRADEPMRYLCPRHGVDYGYCESCGNFIEDLGHRQHGLCNNCEAEDDGEDNRDWQNYGTGNPEEPPQPSLT